MIRFCLAREHVLAALSLAAYGHCQAPSPTTHIAPAPSARFPASWYPADSDVAHTLPPRPDAPYSATLVTTLHFLDPSTGEEASRSQSTLQARDSAGRKRDEVETPRPDGHGGIIRAHEVSVGDPVSHCSFRWMEPVMPPEHPLAIVSRMTRTLHYTGADTFAGQSSASREPIAPDRA